MLWSLAAMAMAWLCPVNTFPAGLLKQGYTHLKKIYNMHIHTLKLKKNQGQNFFCLTKLGGCLLFLDFFLHLYPTMSIVSRINTNFPSIE